MTTYTQAELATRVLRDLGLFGIDETPAADELAFAEETVASEIPMMASIGIPIWNGNELSIPQEYLTVISRRIGLAIAPSYGLADVASAQLAMREAERYLTLMAAPQGAPLKLLAGDATRQSTAGLFNFTTGR